MRRLPLVLLLSLAFSLAGCAADSPDPIAPTPPPVTLLDELMKGGYVVFVRHAVTDQSRQDQPQADLEDCSTQRNLSAAGREQAARIGNDIRALAFPIAEVFSGPLCRAAETATLMSLGTVQVTMDLHFLLMDNRAAQGTRQRLGTVPPPGRNTVLVSHGPNLQEVAGLYVDEGGAVIVRPDGAGGFRHVATVAADQWPSVRTRPFEP